MPTSITSGSVELLDHIEPLWLALRQGHLHRFPRWRESLRKSNFAQRKTELLSKAGGGLLVLLGQSENTTIAYCVCTIDEKQQGEIDSIYVAPTHQHRGIGTALMSAAMAWLADLGVKDISVDVMAGNDDAVAFYARFGFQPRTIRLRRTDI